MSQYEVPEFAPDSLRTTPVSFPTYPEAGSTREATVPHHKDTTERFRTKNASVGGHVHSSEDLPTALVATLVDSAVVHDIKAKLRATVAQKLLGSRTPEELAIPAQFSAIDGILAEHMTFHEDTYACTLSVFASERPAAFEAGVVSTVSQARQVLMEALQHRNVDVTDKSTLEMILQAATDGNEEAMQRLDISVGLLCGAPQLTEPLSRSETLQQRLARLEQQFEQRNRPEHSSTYITERMRKYEAEVDAHAKEEIATAVARLRSTEIARMRAEERAKFDVELARITEVYEEERRKLHEHTSATLRMENDTLGRKMYENDRASMELRARLLADLDTVAARDRITAQQQALTQREIQLERKRWEEMERILLARVTDAEERASHAESNAKLALERWKNDSRIELEERQNKVYSEERRLREERAAFENDRREYREQLARYPQLQVELAELRAQNQHLNATLSEQRKHQHEYEDGRIKAERLLESERNNRLEAEKRVANADARLKALGDELSQLQNTTLATKEEWTAAVRLLRDKLSHANEKLRRQSEQQKAAEKGWKEVADMAVHAERQLWQAQEADWAKDRAKYEAMVRSQERDLHAEQARGDSLRAEVKGLRGQVEELTKSLSEARAALETSSRKHTATALNSPASLKRATSGALVAVGGPHGLLRLSAATPPVVPYMQQQMYPLMPIQQPVFPFASQQQQVMPPPLAYVPAPAPQQVQIQQQQQHPMMPAQYPVYASAPQQPTQAAVPQTAAAYFDETDSRGISAATTRASTPREASNTSAVANNNNVTPREASNTSAVANNHNVSPKEASNVSVNHNAPIPAIKHDIAAAKSGIVQPAASQMFAGGGVAADSKPSVVSHAVSETREHEKPAFQREIGHTEAPPAPTEAEKHSSSALYAPDHVATVSNPVVSDRRDSLPRTSSWHSERNTTPTRANETPATGPIATQTTDHAAATRSEPAVAVKVIPVDEYIPQDSYYGANVIEESPRYNATGHATSNITKPTTFNRRDDLDFADNEFMEVQSSRRSHRDDASEASQDWF